LRCTTSGRQAKLLSDQHLTNLLRFAETSRYPDRNRVIVLLSVKAGLRAAEIANLTWAMVVDATGAVAPAIELHDAAAKNRGGRRIPVHPDLHAALHRWRDQCPLSDFVIPSERGQGIRPRSIVSWFAQAYRAVGLEGCSSHSGRRTFITRAARLVHSAGGSLRDVQLLAGHRSLLTTQRYIDGDTDVQRKLVSLI
jgi:integrase/recombinase XerD